MPIRNSKQPLHSGLKASADAPDPLREVRSLKRWVRIGVYCAIFGSEPLYIFVLHMSATQVVTGLVIGLIIAFTAIEGAFAQMFKLRKRSAYPNVILVRLGGAPGVGDAAANGLATVQQLLRVEVGFVALRNGEGEISLVAAAGIESEAGQLLLGDQAETIAEVMATLQPCVKALGAQEFSSKLLSPILLRPHRLVLVPIVSLKHSIGAIGLVARNGRGDLKDTQLLQAIGVALGLSLENLGQTQELQGALSLLSATLDSTTDGILVVDRDGKIQSFNEKFMQMWRIPRQILEARNDDDALAYVLDQLQQPEAFLKKVRELYMSPEGESYDLLLFKDGRVVERFSKPQRVAGKIAGRVWSFRDITERRAAEAALESSERRFRTMIENSSDGIALVASDGIVSYAGPSTERILGYTAEQMKGMNAFDLMHPDDFGRLAESREFLLAGAGVTSTAEYRLRHKDGRWLWIEGMATNMLDDPNLGAIVANYRDITERKSAEDALRTSEERYRNLVETAQDVIYTLSPEGTLTSLNPAFERITGWPRSEWTGKSFAPLVHPDDLPTGYQQLKRVLAGESVSFELRIKARSGEYLIAEFTATPLLENGRYAGLLGVARDITQRKKAENTIRQLAYHDALTGLPNRALFEDRLKLALSQAGREKKRVAVMFLDLDRFKLVNDTLGHGGGDKLLCGVSEDLGGVLRAGDTVARVGGDEFTILLPAMNDAQHATEIADRILDVLKRPRLIDGQEFSITTSIGITLFPQDGQDAETLLRNADTAMYRAKERGRNNYQLYTPAMNASLIQRLALENDLRHATERGELRLQYQPIARVMDGSIIAAEALVRWEHPDRGIVQPDEFVPYAEEAGLIVPIGEWVLREACLQARAWEDAGYSRIAVAVNLSARQLQQRNLVDLVGQVLQETRLAPEQLQLEITEGAVMKNVDIIITMLHELRSMGVGLSVDDFGTGYSSLSYLKRFPIDSVKIDRSFVRDLATDANDAAIVTTVIAMARNLNLQVIAEGVETEEQRLFLERHGCDAFQGYLISRPISGEALGRLLPPARRSHAKITRLKLA